MGNTVGDKPQNNLGVCLISEDVRGMAGHGPKSTLGPGVRETDRQS